MEPASIAALAIIVLANAYALIRKAPLSLLYAIAILGVYAVEVASSSFGFVQTSGVVRDLGLSLPRGGLAAPWSWITFEFVHASELHVFLNLIGLILISPTFEERVGTVRWAILFFAGGAFGAFVFVLVHLAGPVILVGASAGIFATFGAYGRLFPRDRMTLFLPIPGVPSLPAIQVVVVFLIVEMVLSVFGPTGIAWEAHAGALLFGFAVGPWIMRLPLPGGHGRLASVRGLRDLATTPDLRKLLDETERADLPETRDAWIDAFVRTARCPKCGGPLRRRFGRVVSDCGWRVRR